MYHWIYFLHFTKQIYCMITVTNCFSVNSETAQQGRHTEYTELDWSLQSFLCGYKLSYLWHDCVAPVSLVTDSVVTSSSAAVLKQSEPHRYSWLLIWFIKYIFWLFITRRSFISHEIVKIHFSKISPWYESQKKIWSKSDMKIPNHVVLGWKPQEA